MANNFVRQPYCNAAGCAPRFLSETADKLEAYDLPSGGKPKKGIPPSLVQYKHRRLASGGAITRSRRIRIESRRAFRNNPGAAGPANGGGRRMRLNFNQLWRDVSFHPAVGALDNEPSLAANTLRRGTYRLALRARGVSRSR
jgi:hypothetical protein